MEKQLEFPMDIYPPPLRRIIEDTHRDLNFPVKIKHGVYRKRL